MPLQEELEFQGNWLFKHRGLLPVIVLLPALIEFTRIQYYGKSLISQDYEVFFTYLCFAVTMFGFIIRIYTVGHAAPNTSGRNTKEQKADSINTKGIYSTVRHPLYVANYILFLGFILLVQGFWFLIAFTLIYWIYYERIMIAEEQFLRNKFGKNYLDWAKKTPAFIPNIRLFKHNNTAFNWRKILYKEKNGLLAIFVIFFLFENLGDAIKNGKFEWNWDIWSYGMIVSFFLYVLFRTLRRNTGLLHS